MKFQVGDRVRKVDGSYQATGHIVAAFRTRANMERYVFEFLNPKGMLHIFGPGQLERWDLRKNYEHEPETLPK